MLHIKKNDMVVVKRGKEKGKRAKVLRVLPSDGKVVLEGLNIITKHAKKRRQEDQGGIIKKESPINISNVMLYCAKCKKAVRTGFVRKKDSVNRVCKKCNQEL